MKSIRVRGIVIGFLRARIGVVRGEGRMRRIRGMCLCCVGWVGRGGGGVVEGVSLRGGRGGRLDRRWEGEEGINEC